MEGSLTRYIKRYPATTFLRVLSELEKGKKETCWMWYVFPQLRGLAKSRKAFVFGILGEEEARQYLSHPVLGKGFAPAARRCFATPTKRQRIFLGKAML